MISRIAGYNYNSAKTQNFSGGPNRRTSDPYPVGGGNVERLEYETKHGWTGNNSSDDPVADDIQTRRDNERFKEWESNYGQYLGPADDDDDD